jgi:hypothetical protein
MEGVERIRCRVAACREPLAGTGRWCFYLINDGDGPLDSAQLYRVSTEWGDFGNSRAADVRVGGLAPGAHALVWRDDGELRIELALLVRAGDREARLTFEFPRLYRQTGLPLVGGLGKPGLEVAAEG